MKIETLDQLEAIYGTPDTIGEASTAKVVSRMIPQYRAYIEASPFAALATVAPEGLDCSPRGDTNGFVHIHDDKTLMIPDRRGNNRVDSLRNIVRDPRVALLFLIPGSGTTFRVNGRASISVDPELMQSFAVNGKLPRSVMIIHVDTAFFHCSKAVVRSKLWDEKAKIDRKSLPSTGTIIAELSHGKLGGDNYDREMPERIKAQLY